MGGMGNERWKPPSLYDCDFDRNDCQSMCSVHQSAREWADEARKSLAAAQTLAAGRHWRHAYLTCGLAVELALKARIMHNERLNQWPLRSERRELYDHKAVSSSGCNTLITG